ncbi:MAG: hypothetical protein J1F63_08075 [Oscillospiraceae bacterium]|nr:hypothetical protein [Oscillospiraceae bacterium]
MKKLIAVLSVALLLLAACGTSIDVEPFDPENPFAPFDDMEYMAYIEKITGNVKEKGCIRTEEAALKIGEVILTDVYGDSLNIDNPFRVRFSEEYDAWQIIDGELPENTLGGNHYVMISRETGEVMAIWGTK